MSLLDTLNKQRALNNAQEMKEEVETSPRMSSDPVETQEQEEYIDPYTAVKEELQRDAVNALNENYSADLNMTRDEFVRHTVSSLMLSKDYPVPRSDRQIVVDAVVAEIIGLGPIQKLINDPNISEVMVNGPDSVYVEEKGRLHKTNVKFKDNKHVMTIIDRIVTPLGRHIDESSPMVDARLVDGSRVNAIVPPLALNGPTITIRKFPNHRLTAENLIHWGSASARMMQFLEACVKGKLNIVVSGGTGSGKTTLLNILSAYIPNNERILTIEDAAELQLQQDHVVRLEARPANTEGKGRVAIKDLVVNALRMRPDRIVVGECRGGEALDMLQAMNTGHDGSLTTGHANSPKDMMGRLETMVMMAGMDLPERAIREQIASAINIVVQQARLRDGSRKITSITEITGMEGDQITMQEIYHFRQTGYDENGKIIGVFEPTGIRPNCMDKLEMAGCGVSNDWFSKR